MKARLLLVIAFLLSFVSTWAQEKLAKSSEKEYFYNAKDSIIAMLNGKQPISYEKAIYYLENAWWNNRLNFETFQDAITEGINHIKVIEEQNTYKKEPESKNFYEALRQKSHQDAGYINTAKTNYAIYSYITDTTHFLNKTDGTTSVHYPFSYTTSDPLGTIDWENTQVGSLLLKGKGNCFAYASLFKIYSDRLQSKASICTAPGHIYITHKDDNGRQFNVELASKAFPGTGTLATLTYTTQDAIKNNISLRPLDEEQSVALTLIYLAKSFESKFPAENADTFALSCASVALQYDSLNLNALLLKAEVQERALIASEKSIEHLRGTPAFQDYETLLKKLYRLGYREMPLDMKNILLKGWTRDTVTFLAQKNYLKGEKADENGLPQLRYASLSWGLFDEDIVDKPIERYSRTLFDTKKLQIKDFTTEQSLYNNYNFDPVLFALNVDPLASKFPSISPYAFCNNNPIYYVDPSGAAPNPFRLLADLARDFTKVTTKEFIATAANSGYFNKPEITSRTYGFTRLGRIFESAVLESMGESKYSGAGFRGSTGVVKPDLVGSSIVNVHNDPFKPTDIDRYEFKNASFIDAKFKSTVGSSDDWNPDQMRNMVDALANMRGGFKNGKWDASLKATDFGAASITIVSPSNTEIDPGFLDYATSKNVVIYQRTVQQDEDNPNRIRVGAGGSQINGAVKSGVSLPKAPGQSTVVDYNVR
ncbi:MAG: hypothetical protein BGO70_16400 [Bacteroidetes bacterium 43-93]|nr:hypothetical protein [Bacteroidota bacterium]OJX01343.1 MAG: hypothetical protein BGO70_16400 [Bacteroidetes bacterium 43-93]